MQSGSLLLPPLPKTRRTKPRISHEMQQQPPRIDHLPPPPPLPPSPPPPPPYQFTTTDTSNNNLRELLIECAAAVSSSDWHRAIHFLVLLRRSAPPDGDSAERLACYFSTALARCIYSLVGLYDPSIHSLLHSHNLLFTPDVFQYHQCHMHLDSSDEEYSAYRALNQVTPFIRFAHLSANQAILESVDNEKAVHIVDLEIMQGLQWPPLMQALAERRRLKQLEAEQMMACDEAGSGSSSSVAQEDFSLTLRITGTGPSMELLEQTGARLRDFARTLSVDFEFNPICCSKDDNNFESLHEQLELRQGEALVVNCMTQLHRLLPAARRAALPRALEFIRSLSPRIVTVAEKEFEHDYLNQGFMDRFIAALEYYGAVFDSLEATLAPRNPQRLMIERLVLAKEVSGLVLEDGGDGEEEEESGRGISSSSSSRSRSEKQTVVRYQSFTRWRQAIEGAGFSLVPPSDFSIAQARLLLRLHYPADGYRLVFENEQGCLFLSWHNKPLVALSAWSSP